MILAPQKKEGETSLASAIQHSSYLLDAWIKASFPSMQEILFDSIQKNHDKYLTKLAELKEKESEQLLKEQMANLALKSSQRQKNQAKTEVHATEEIHELRMGYINKIHKTSNLCPYPAPFNPELIIPPVTSSDFCLIQKQLFKQILLNIKENKDISDFDYETLICFFRNLYIAMSRGRNWGFLNQNQKYIYNIIKFGINLFTLAHEWKLEAPLFVNEFSTEVSFFLIHCSLWLAEDESVKAQSELELLYAESYVEWANNTYEMSSSSVLFNEPQFKDLIHSIHAKFAMIALKKNDIPGFLTSVDKIGFNQNTDLIICEVLMAAAKNCQKSDPKRALGYLDKALFNLEEFIKRPIALNFMIKTQEMRESCFQISDDIKVALAEQLKVKIKEHCPSFKVKPLKKPGQLQLFKPLEQAPKSISMAFPFLKIIIENSKDFTGLTIVTDSLDEDKIIRALKDIERHLTTKLKHKANIKKAHVHPKTPSVREEKSESMSVHKEQGKIACGFISSPEEPYVKPTQIKKEKTRQDAAQAPLPETAHPTPINEFHTLDFGFNIAGNPLITPVYCTRAAQKAGHTQLYLRWEGVPGADPVVEKQFEGMLNPHLDGILTVGTYGQPGAKLWKDPANLADNWDHCGLRLKRKGAAGFLRVVAIPESKITVEHDGITENRYLFKLGKMKHK